MKGLVYMLILGEHMLFACIVSIVCRHMGEHDVLLVMSTYG